MFNPLRIIAHIIVGLIVSTTVFSCQTTAPPNTTTESIQADLYVRYLQTEQEYKAEISFAAVDSTKKLVPKKMEEVFFQKLAMNGKQIQQTYRYQLNQIASFKEQYTFAYRLEGQELQEQSIFLNAIDDFFIKGNQLSKSVKNTIVFKGKLLKSNESLILLFSNEDNVVTTVAIAGPSTDLGITIYPAQIKKLKLGKGSLYLVRRQKIEENIDNINLTGLTEYYSKVIDIDIIE